LDDNLTSITLDLASNKFRLIVSRIQIYLKSKVDHPLADVLASAATVPKSIGGLRLQEGAATKLVVREAGVQIKIEVMPVLRGCAYESELRVSPAVEAEFGFAEMTTHAPEFVRDRATT
jgi:hypothetical protein